MENGVTYTVKAVTDSHVCVIEHIDLTHPNSPVVSFKQNATWVAAERWMGRMEYAERFGEQPITPQE